MLVFLYMLRLETISSDVLRAFVERAALTPAALLGKDVPHDVLEPVWLTVFTSMFLHGGPLHIGGNMLYLWIFGNNVEDTMGSGRFLLFYLLCGVVAAVAQIATGPDSTVPMLGASGAVAGVLGAYVVRFPAAQVETCIFFFFITIIRLPALIVLGFWFLLQFTQGVAALSGADPDGGIAWWAHIGGFVAGMLFINLFAKRHSVRYNNWH
ncbi:MAG: Rhomboid protease GluP [bacterium ADurb.Bin429]|nr:MAG: Rhomboid protease GluP [bacterium ADurb.Bin429]